MKFDPEKHHRRSIRLKGYDYSQSGYYYVTISSQNRECFFGEIIDSEIFLNKCGKMIENVWKEIPMFYRGSMIDEYIVMPNHIHGIIGIDVGVDPCIFPDNRVNVNNENNRINGQVRGPAPTSLLISLPEIIKRFKTLTTKKYIYGVRNHFWDSFNKRLWQRNYYEHIIRGKEELDNIRKYIRNNPHKWFEDENNPVNIKTNRSIY